MPSTTVPVREDQDAIRILMVDDDHDDYVLVEHMLSGARSPYEVDWVADARSAAETIVHQEHDVYLIDQKLGSDDGLDLIFRARRAGCDRPMILLTGHEAPRFDEYSMEHGAADYLSKNHFDLDAIDRSIRHALARWRLERQMNTLEQRFRRVFEASPIGMILANGAQEVVDVNAALADILNRPRAALVGKRLEELFDTPTGDLSAHTPTTVPRRVPAGIVRDGVVREVDVIIAALEQQSDRVSQLVQVVDLTELREARRQMEQLIVAKDEFLASISHELRTPLTAVLGFAAVLVGEDTDLSQGERDELLRAVHRQSIDLANIIEDLLVAARADTDQIQIASQTVDVAGQIRDIIDAMALSGDPVPVFDPQPVQALVDPLRFRQILRNLLTNALRFGGPEVVVDVEATESHVVVVVKDNGSGPASEVADRIFEPYVRLSDNLTTPRSIGLGLAVARHLARLMDGELDFNREDGWTVFRLKVPPA